MKRNLILAAALLILVFPVWAGEVNTLHNSQFGFSLEYPAAWETQDIENNCTILVPTPESEDAIPIVVMVMAEAIPEEDQGKDYDTLMAEAIQDLEATFSDQGLEDFEIIEQGAFDFHGYPAYKLNLKISVLGMINMLMDNIIIRQEKDFIYLSFTADEESYPAYNEAFSTIKDSFKLDEAVIPE